MIVKSKQSHHESEIPELEQLRAPESLDTWLTVFTRLIKLPESQQLAIRDEIEAHLRERIRDLMIAGMDENQALVQSIDELGEAANLADRFTLANTSHKRKRIMQLSLLGLATSSVIVGVIATSPSPSTLVERSVYESTVISDELPDWFDTRSVTIDNDDWPFGEFIEWVGELNGSTNVAVHWQQLADYGLDRETPVSLHLQNETSPRRVLDLAMQQLNGEIGESELTWWHGDGLLEVGSREFFMQQTTELASYDLRHIMDGLNDLLSHSEAQREILSLITTMVSPADWQMNGGQFGQIEMVGTQLFINAPAEMHAQVQWILDELAKNSKTVDAQLIMPGGGGMGGGASGGAGGMGTGGAGGLGGGGGAGGR